MNLAIFCSCRGGGVFVPSPPYKELNSGLLSFQGLSTGLVGSISVWLRIRLHLEEDLAQAPSLWWPNHTGSNLQSTWGLPAVLSRLLAHGAPSSLRALGTRSSPKHTQCKCWKNKQLKIFPGESIQASQMRSVGLHDLISSCRKRSVQSGN